MCTSVGVQARLDRKTCRTSVGVTQRSGHERRHGGAGHVARRVEGRCRNPVMDPHVVELLDGVGALNSDRTGIDIGVVVLTGTGHNASTVAGHIGRRRSSHKAVSVGLATRTSLHVFQPPLDEHCHLFTGDVVVRSEGRRRLTNGDAQLADLVDRQDDFSRLATDISEALVDTGTERAACRAERTGEVQSHRPTRHRIGRRIGRRRRALGDVVHRDAVDISRCGVGKACSRSRTCRTSRVDRCRTDDSYRHTGSTE